MGCGTDLLSLALIGTLILVVDAGEVTDDDGDREGYHKHTGQGADAAHDLAGDCCGHHVAVSDGEKSSERGSEWGSVQWSGTLERDTAKTNKKQFRVRAN